MTFESRGMKDIPSLNASDNEWKKYWNSCSISELSWYSRKVNSNGQKKEV